MALHDDSTVLADSPAEVLAELIPGYEFASPPEQQAARITHAHQAAAIAQLMHLDLAARTDLVDPADPVNAGWLGIVKMDKSLSLGLEAPDRPGEPADWLPSVPLVLVTTSYAPHTASPPIGGNVIWIDPVTEAGYLASLGDSGVFNYWTDEGTQA